MSADEHAPESISLHRDAAEAEAAAWAEAPVLVVKSLPKPLRHGAVIGAFESLAPGATMIVVEPHDPTPLLDQIRDRFPGGVDMEYVERGPQEWRVRLIRR